MDREGGGALGWVHSCISEGPVDVRGDGAADDRLGGKGGDCAVADSLAHFVEVFQGTGGAKVIVAKRLEERWRAVFVGIER